MSLWKRMIAGVDYLSGRFEVVEVTTDADRQEVIELLDAVRRKELNRVHGSSVLESAAFADRKVDDVLLGCRDTRTGKIVGCVRATPASELAAIASSREEYALDAFPEAMLPEVAVATRLAVFKEYRGTVASLVLLEHMYEEGIRRGFQACVLTCEPGLYKMYLRTGFRPYARVHASPTGGWRLPMVLPVFDAAHLDRTGSPLAKVLRRWDGPRDDRAVRWYRDLLGVRGSFDPGIAAWEDRDGSIHQALTDGLSAAGVAMLLEGAMELSCEAGQVVIKQGDGGLGMGVVLEGMLEVQHGDRTLAIFGQGELFGEISSVLGGTRSANVVAAVPETRVLMLSRTALERDLPPEDAARVWQNLAKQLAGRLVASNFRS